MLLLENICVSFGTVPVLRGVSFKVGEGEAVAFVGRNGAGKTTTLRTIMGFTKNTGRLQFDGADLNTVEDFRRPGLGIGYAPEDRRLFSRFTVEENILLPAQVAKLSAAETKRRLDRVYDILPELREMARRPAGSVSGGQGKMVALARALMLATRLVLLDEPFQGLAPVLANRYAEALRRLRDAEPSLALVITESNPHLLRSFAERIITIERGEIAQDVRNEGLPA
ncbi:ATP-binding cassette domain-containing protein [Xanthobacter sp. VNH20]|uniref:ABC transporter ATP-binding protein n=1 Tax=Xanthobacter sp. VNH20 TaxID=3156616 RepID=UPI0032B52E8D